MTKVMLVEDDNNLREIYQARLQAEGYDIVAAKDGEEALVLAKAENPELVISDVMMPKISGFEMLDILRNTEGLKHVKVIMLTALGQSDDQLRADKLGADRYLVKSQVTLEDIIKVAHELIDGEEAPAAAVAAATAAEPIATMEVAAAPAAPATPAEPVAVAPAPEPTAAPATPAPEPVTNPAVTDSTQSVAQEEAAVEAKIEDFVAGASSEATPTEAAAPTTEPAAEPSVIIETIPAAPQPPAPAPTPDPVATTDDKIMDDAVNSLIASTEPAAPGTPAIVIEPSQTPAASEPAEGNIPAPASASVKPDETVAATPATTIETLSTDKKVISPITDNSKPSIEALLAKEEAKNIEAGAPVPPAQPIVPNTTVAPGDATDGPKIDPNSIAL
jgi:CheY-like chemotaxis protein